MAEDTKEMKEIYEKFRQKHTLPEFEKLHRVLEITCIDDNDLVLVSIKNKIKDKISRFLDILESIVQPDTSTASMYESRYLSDEDRVKAFDIYKKLMIISKQSDISSIEDNDNDNAHLINSFFASFPGIAEDFKGLLAKQKESWQRNDQNNDDFLGYFG